MLFTFCFLLLVNIPSYHSPSRAGIYIYIFVVVVVVVVFVFVFFCFFHKTPFYFRSFDFVDFVVIVKV